MKAKYQSFPGEQSFYASCLTFKYKQAQNTQGLLFWNIHAYFQLVIQKYALLQPLTINYNIKTMK